MRPKTVVLIVLDGFGHDSGSTESPWQLSNHPTFEDIEKYYPFTTLQASGIAVGLPWGKEGNSEVGHLTIGSGRILYNHLPRIEMSIHDKTFFQNKAFLKAAEHVKKNNSKLHIMGLFSSGCVHSYADHLYALLDLAKEQQVERTFLHLFTDGRDAHPYEGAEFFRKFEERLTLLYPNARLASVIGRHFAMDRDGKWEKIEKAYKLLTEGAKNTFQTASLYIERNYQKDLTDEYIEPAVLEENGKIVPSRIENNDAVVFFNFREDSEREITSAFVKTEFDKFPRKKIADLVFVTMTQYDPSYPAEVAFYPIQIENTLSKVIALQGFKQLHIAETEKYAHITYFFNGGKEEPNVNEERMLVPSPKTAHYDDVPEMSSEIITQKITENLDNYDFIVANYANTDMVGHTGNFEACIKAIEAIDRCIGKLVPKILASGGVVLITADHGNIEEKLYKLTGEKMTKHTTNPVPFYLIGREFRREQPLEHQKIERCYKICNGVLADVAPTVLDLMGIRKPEEMTGSSLVPIIVPGYAKNGMLH